MQRSWLASSKSSRPARAFVLDRFRFIRQIDAVTTHDHNDHIDVNVAAAVMQNCADDVPFIGRRPAWLWVGWGVPKNALHRGKTGRCREVKDIEIHALDALTAPH